MSSPLVSIIMPAYNAGKYIAASVQSVIDQTYTNWELIIIDDGSTDGTTTIIYPFTSKDDRIKLHSNESNKGLIYTRNKGLELANGKYIANLDSDDLSFPERIERQVTFMENNPDYVLYGSAAEIIDSEGKKVSIEKRNIPNHLLKSLLLFSNYFINSSLIILAEPAKHIGYLFPVTEDYYLASRLSKKGKIGNSSSVLVRYRIHESNISQIKEDVAKNSIRSIQKLLLENLGISPSAKEIETHAELVNKNKSITESELEEIEKWLLRLKNANDSLAVYDEKSFNYWCAFFYRRSCEKSKLGLEAVVKFKKSPLSQYLKKDIKGNSAFFVKSIVKK